MNTEIPNRIRLLSIAAAVLISFGIAYLLVVLIAIQGCVMGWEACSWGMMEMSIRAAGYVALGGMVAWLLIFIDEGISALDIF